MADVTRLLAVLTDYHAVLSDQHRCITEAHNELSGRFQALNEVYEGAGASEFKAGWGRVRATFDAYSEGVPSVLALLDDKIEQLRRLDRGF